MSDEGFGMVVRVGLVVVLDSRWSGKVSDTGDILWDAGEVAKGEGLQTRGSSKPEFALLC